MRVTALLILVGGCPALATGWALTIAVREWAGRRPLAVQTFRNSAEAAAAGDAASVLRLLRSGESPARVYPVRPHFISSAVVRVTTLEAALWSRSIHMVRALDRAGAIVTDEQRRDLACLARDLDQPHVAEYLAPGVSCVPDQAMTRIVARSAHETGEDHD